MGGPRHSVDGVRHESLAGNEGAATESSERSLRVKVPTGQGGGRQPENAEGRGQGIRGDALVFKLIGQDHAAATSGWHRWSDEVRACLAKIDRI